MYNLEKLLSKALDICDKENIPYRNITEIKVNNRLSKSWGRCLTKNHTDFWIEIKGKICDEKVTPNENGLLEIILHEVIHTCEGCWNHGKLFKEYGGRLEKYGYNVGKSTTSAAALQLDNTAYKETFKYAIQCTGCGNIIYKDKMMDFVRFPHFYSCKKCGKTFTRIR